MLIEITRKVEFDAGHRIPNHKSKCRNLHGHRYVLEATVEGELIASEGASDNAMVQDFGDLKEILNRAVVDKWDHSLLLYRGDAALIEAIGECIAGHRTVVLDVVPTVEALAALAASMIAAELAKGDHHGIWLSRLRLYETPNCWADWCLDYAASLR